MAASKMTKVKKWLSENLIEFKESNGYVTITLEAGNIWINGFGKPMKWDREIIIYQNQYGEYIVNEKCGYSMMHRHIWTGKQTSVIDILNKRLITGEIKEIKY